MDSFKYLAFAFVFAFLPNFCFGEGPEQGIFNVTLTEDKPYAGVSKILQPYTDIAITVDCPAGDQKFVIEWIGRHTSCSEYKPGSLPNSTAFIESLFSDNKYDDTMLTGEDLITFLRSNASEEMTCGKSDEPMKDETEKNYWVCYSTYPSSEKWCKTLLPTPTPSPSKAPTSAKPKQDGKSSAKKVRRDAPSQKQTAGTAETKPVATTSKPKATGQTLKNRVTQTNEKAGRYWFLVHLKTVGPKSKTSKLELFVKIEMKSPNGYLSAFQFPLLVFYGVMCGAYSVLAFIWLVLLATQWRDLLRIQYWIGGLMLLGLLEKAVFYAEYENVSKTGISVPGAIIIAELVSCAKRSLARMLVVIVSLGYGITRPRLGRDLHWVLGAGMAYFVLSSIEACLRVKGMNDIIQRYNPGGKGLFSIENRHIWTEQHALIAVLPLAVLDAIICWWVFKSLVDTTRTLRLRRNLVKLWLYRHFTNTLIFCVVAAVIFLLWSTKTHRWTECVKKWHELWLDEAYWHVLFCVILVVIVILFRPTANNQRYAYSPLTDRDQDDESQEPMISDAFEGMKLRNVVTNRNESHTTTSKVDDDLKWVEDNIPASVADAALGAFDDSEEELVTNLERSKME